MAQAFFGIIVAAIILLLVISQIIPLMTGTMEMAEEPAPGIDAKVKFDALVGAASTLNTYTYMTSMPRDSMGQLNWDAVEPLQKSKAKNIFKGKLGQLFVRSLVETNYYEKHEFECAVGRSATAGGACSATYECTKVGESIYGGNGGGLPEEDIEDELSENTRYCIKVADYIMRRSQYLAKQAEVTSGTLSDGWTEAPP